MAQVITVFRSRLRDDVSDDYFTLAAELRERAGQIDGFVEQKVFVAEDGERLTLVIFDTDAGQQEWRTDPVHRAAQQRGRDEFYDAYDVTVCEAQRRHAWQRD
ncbi:MAG: antibiotic biosynthesis monooxygenase [Acidimicrobiia bacterium]